MLTADAGAARRLRLPPALHRRPHLLRGGTGGRARDRLPRRHGRRAAAGRACTWARLSVQATAELPGNSTPDDLPRVLSGADVGIVPSVWEEAYGLTGPKMLAGGVPLIGNALGGIPDYVVPGETGWLNRSASGAELAELMARVIERPPEVADLRRRL